MHRRDVVFAGLTLPFLGPLALAPRVTLAAAEEKPTAFDPMQVRQLARDLAQKPYKPPDTNLPAPLKDLNYDAYRKIRFNLDRALWRNDKLPFQVQFFHRGFFFSNRVDVFEVDNGQARALAGDAATPFGQCSDALLEAALRNLDGHVSVAGLTERFDETLIMLEAEFGWQNLYYVQTNTAPAGGHLHVSDAERQMIAERNRYDCELYRIVAERFQARIDETPGVARRLELHRRGNALYAPWGRFAHRLRRTAVRATRSRPPTRPVRN